MAGGNLPTGDCTSKVSSLRSTVARVSSRRFDLGKLACAPLRDALRLRAPDWRACAAVVEPERRSRPITDPPDAPRAVLLAGTPDFSVVARGA